MQSQEKSVLVDFYNYDIMIHICRTTMNKNSVKGKVYDDNKLKLNYCVTQDI